MRPEAERLFVKRARERGLLTVTAACDLADTLARLGEAGLQAARDRAVRLGLLSEQDAYAVYREVAAELRALEELPPVIDGYRIAGVLGRGSMGVVYQAEQLSLGRMVALKVLPPRLGRDGVFLERFLREARAAARLNHPNIVAALDAGSSAGLYYIAMELVDGCTVKEIVTANGPLGEREALKVTYAVARALEHVHAAGLVHRDVKPSNIMVARDGRIKLTDLGLVHMADEADGRLTQHGSSVGTPYYMSPEQALERRAVDHRSDFYALGASLFYMLVGRPPFDGPTPSVVLARHLKAPVPDPRTDRPEVSAATARLLAWLLAKDPRRRPQHAREIAERVRQLLHPGAGGARSSDALLAPVVPPGGRGSMPRTAGLATTTPSPSRLEPVSSATVRRLRGTSGRRAALAATRRRGRTAALLACTAVAGAGLLVGAALLLARPGADGPGEASGADRKAAAGAGALALASAGAPPSSAAGNNGRPEPAGAMRAGALDPYLEALRRRNEMIPVEAWDLQAYEAELAREQEQQARASAEAIGAAADRLAGEAAARAAAERAALARARRAEEQARQRERLLAAIARYRAGAAPAELAAQFIEGWRQSVRGSRVQLEHAQDASLALALELLPQLVALELAARTGSQERVVLGGGTGVLQGEIARAEGEELLLRTGGGAEVGVPLGALALQELGRLARGPLGTCPPEVAVCEAIDALFRGDLDGAAARAERARHLLAAARPGPGLAVWQQRLEELHARLQALAADQDLLAALEPRRGAGPPTPSPAAPGEPPAEPLAGDREREAGGGSGAGSSQPRLGTEEVTFDERTLLRLFETLPVAWDGQGRVRLRYELLGGAKRLGRDFTTRGALLRYDANKGVLKLEQHAGLAMHRAVLAGTPRMELEVVFETAPDGAGSLVLICEDVEHGTIYEAPFALALLAPGGRTAGSRAPHVAAAQEIRRLTPYRLHIAVHEGGLVAAGVDGQVRAHLEGPGGGRYRFGLRWDRVNVQLRAVTLQGALDRSWVAQELAGGATRGGRRP